MRLKDRVAVVTGGGGGIGKGICLCMAREGAHIVVSDQNRSSAEKVAAEISKLGRKTLAIQTNVCMAKDCKDLIEFSLKEMGQIDILVCCTGVPGYSDKTIISDEMTRVENISEDDWDLTLNTNLKGVFLCNRAIVPYFKQQRKGKIINISSIAGRRGSDWLPHYSASKAGVIVFSQVMAIQLGPYNVNVNTICPGFVWTSMSVIAGKVMSKTYPQFKDMNPTEVFNEIIRTRVPLGRPQTPDSIGNAAVFLASDEAEDVTGQAINVDGGVVFN
ncbi:MAG: SDR family NAD(P)-dependent oxidoreductase [Thermodesulfobacteriota bacterium]